MTDPMSDDKLDAIRARHAAATPGPWEPCPEHGPKFYAYQRGEHLRGVADMDFGQGYQAEADEAFVIHAEPDMAALLADNARLREANAALDDLRIRAIDAGDQARVERDRYRIAWRRARTRALSTGGAADRYAARARKYQEALQESVVAIVGAQMERDAAQKRVAELEAAAERHAQVMQVIERACDKGYDPDRFELAEAAGIPVDQVAS